MVTAGFLDAFSMDTFWERYIYYTILCLLFTNIATYLCLTFAVCYFYSSTHCSSVMLNRLSNNVLCEAKKLKIICWFCPACVRLHTHPSLPSFLLVCLDKEIETHDKANTLQGRILF